MTKYRRKHTVYYSHFRSARERWADFKAMVRIFLWGAAVAAVVVIVIVGRK